MVHLLRALRLAACFLAVLARLSITQSVVLRRSNGTIHIFSPFEVKRLDAEPNVAFKAIKRQYRALTWTVSITFVHQGTPVNCGVRRIATNSDRRQ